MRVSRTLSWIAAVGFTASAAAQFDSGSDGSDGAFTPSEAETVIELALADTGVWDDVNIGNGNGVYDPDLWAVVFQYSTVTIPAGVTVRFENHPSGAPVVWLASGDVTIQSTVDVSPTGGTNDGYEIPGPGGFAGGLGPNPGFGPAGGISGGYASAYGNPSILPLIGGSGGSEKAGAGAILIASSTNILFLDGAQIRAVGGLVGFSNQGGGGGIRLIANSISGPGVLTAIGGGVGGGGDGRIRLEAFDLNGFTGSSNPLFTVSGPGPVFPPSDAPTLRATFINNEPVPADPIAGPWSPDVLVDSQLVTIHIEAMNIPVDTQVEVQLRPGVGGPLIVTSPPLKGSFAFSTTDVLVLLPVKPGLVPVEVQLIANWPK